MLRQEIGQLNKTADVPGEMERNETSSYSPEFLYIEIEEVGVREKAPVEIGSFGEDSDGAMKFETVNEEVTAKDRTNLRDIPSQGNDSNIMLYKQLCRNCGISCG